MTDTVFSLFSWFDAIAVGVILLSALMALSRGFMRELATLGAFIAALAAAFYARLYLRGHLASVLPDASPAWSADAIIVVTAFLIVYILVRWLGSRLSRNIQGAEGVTMVDRMAGFIFGAARGVIATVFFVLLLNVSLPENRIPDWIVSGASYPTFQTAASLLSAGAPRLADELQDNLPEPGEER
ncbi:MAG: CvpA family protein [Pseudomonadota bacterium]